MSQLKQLQLYVTPTHDCSYIDGRSSRMLFVDPHERLNTPILTHLSASGFRRSGDFVYKPDCNHCRQCLSVRLPVALFKPNKSQKRALKANQDIHLNMIDSSEAGHIHYKLFATYINERHRDGDMFPPNPEQFEKFLVNSPAETVFLEYWLADRLIGVAVCDVLHDGISAVYTFYDPAHTKRSIGTFSVLKQIEFVRSINKQHLYLGYWVPESSKMRYKCNFAPQEIFINEKWHRQTRKFTEKDIEKLLFAINASAYEKIKLINIPVEST